MSHKVLIVDGVDTYAEYGLVVEIPDGWRDSVFREWEFEHAPRMIAGVELASVPGYSEKPFSIQGSQWGADVAELQANLDGLKHLLMPPDELEIKFADLDTRHYRMRMQGRIRVEGVHARFLQPAHEITIPLIAIDPRAYEDTEQEIAFSGRVQMPQGTAPTEPEIVVASGSFTLTYRNADDDVLHTLEVSGATGAPITVNMRDKTIINASGEGQIDTLVSGFFFALSPYDGTYPDGPWPTLQSTASATATYRKAYW